MTQEQAKRLCELEPEHFEPFMNCLYLKLFRSEILVANFFSEKADDEMCKFNRLTMLWWMVTRMPAVVLCAPIMGGNWTCDDSRLERFLGSAETPEEAVIMAYITWLESRQTK